MSEHWLKHELMRLTLQLDVSRERLSEVVRRRGVDLMTLMDYRNGRPRTLAADELQGRASGSSEWRSARGEIGTAGPASRPAVPSKPSNPPLDWIAVRPGVFDLQCNGHSKLRQPLALQLTPNETDKCGSIFTKSTFDLSKGIFGFQVKENIEKKINFFFLQGFFCQFEFVLERNGDGADGFAFVMHQSAKGAHALGTSGCQLGYGGIPQSIAVEIDCYQNQDLANDPNACHISVQTRWEKENSSHHDYSLACCTDPTGTTLQHFLPNHRYLVRIYYDAVDKTLSIGCDDAGAQAQPSWTPKLSLPFALRSLVVRIYCIHMYILIFRLHSSIPTCRPSLSC